MFSSGLRCLTILLRLQRVVGAIIITENVDHDAKIQLYRDVVT